MKQTTMDSVMCIDIHEADDVAQSYASGLTEENMAYSVQRTQLNGILGISACYNEHGHLTSVVSSKLVQIAYILKIVFQSRMSVN